MPKPTSRELRRRRHRRVRKKVAGSPARPRLAVFRSCQHIYAQVIDDTRGRTLVAACSLEAAVQRTDGTTKTAAAQVVGRLVAQRALDQGVTAVVFDRGGFIYHGRVQALADAAREAGLRF